MVQAELDSLSEFQVSKKSREYESTVILERTNNCINFKSQSKVVIALSSVAAVLFVSIHPGTERRFLFSKRSLLMNILFRDCFNRR